MKTATLNIVHVLFQTDVASPPKIGQWPCPLNIPPPRHLVCYVLLAIPFVLAKFEDATNAASLPMTEQSEAPTVLFYTSYTNVAEYELLLQKAFLASDGFDKQGILWKAIQLMPQLLDAYFELLLIFWHKKDWSRAAAIGSMILFHLNLVVGNGGLISFFNYSRGVLLSKWMNINTSTIQQIYVKGFV